MVFSLQSTRNASEVFVITYCANPHWARYTHICTHNITLDHNEVQAKTFKAFSCYKPTHRLFFTLPHTHMKPQKPRTQSYTHRTAGFSTNGSSNLPPHTHPHTQWSLWVYWFAVTQSDVMCNLAACLFDETLVWLSRGSLPDRTHNWSGQLSPADIVFFFPKRA